MKVIDNSTHVYIITDEKMYINIDIKLMKLYLLLYFRAKPFSMFERKTGNRIFNILPITIVRAIRVGQFILKFNKKKKMYRLKATIPVVTAKHFGHCLLKLRQGEYKIFNFNNHEVLTLFPDDISDLEIEDRLSNIKELAKCKIAPKVIKWNIKRHFIIEDYINYKRPQYDFNNVKKFCSDVFPILKDIMTTNKSNKESLPNYFLKEIDYLRLVFKKLKMEKMVEQDNVNFIEMFFEYLWENLKYSDNDERILLVSSHGDFWEGNILVNSKYSRIIDWNTFGYRSCYFDFFYFMFMLASKNYRYDGLNVKGLHNLENIWELCFDNFTEYLKENDILFSHKTSLKSPKHKDIYRYLFYLELISLKVKDTEIIGRDQLNEITTWVKRFKLFEEIRAGKIVSIG